MIGNNQIKPKYVIEKIIQGTIPEVSINKILNSQLIRKGNILTVKNLSGEIYKLNIEPYDEIIILGVGKASYKFSDAFQDLFPDKKVSGLIVSKEKVEDNLNGIKFVKAGHPIPDYQGIKAAKQIISILKRTERNKLIFFLLSGGASSLLPLPIEGFSLKEKVKIAKRETSTSLREKLGNLAGNLLLSNLEKIIAGKIEPISQNEKEATYTKFFKKEDGLIDWEEDAKLIERKIRAFTPWPGTFTFFETPKKKIRVKILYAEVEEGNALKPEEIKIENKKLKIKTGKDYIVVKKLQPEGKREMIAEEFLHGYQIKLKV